MSNKPHLGPDQSTPHPPFFPTIHFSPQRVSKACLAKQDPAAILECWLTEHTNVAAAISWHNSTYQGAWSTWPGWLRTELQQHFREMVEWYCGLAVDYPSPFPMPLQTGLGQPPLVFGPRMMEYRARSVYLSYVANTLAAEMTGALPWSITTYTDPQMYLLLNWNDQLQCSDLTTSHPSYYLMGNLSPATPGFVASFFRSHALVGTDALDTVGRLVAWERCLFHYFVSGKQTAYNWADFWGPQSPPVPASYVINGTTYAGPEAYNPPLVAHFTAGCGGTTAFMKSVLRAVNIPVESRSCGKSPHQTPFFPTIDRGLSHGDDPYNTNGIVTPFPGWPVPAATEYLTTGAQWNQWFGPNLDYDTCDHNVGRRIADLAIHYQSDNLLKAYCQDQAAQLSHANGAVLKALAYTYGLADLEAVHLWDKLAAKATATGYCSLPQAQ